MSHSTIPLSRVKGLQWGRGLLTADVPVGVYNAGTVFVLQWGRGLLTADVAKIEGDRVSAVALQWGRGLLTADVPFHQ